MTRIKTIQIYCVWSAKQRITCALRKGGFCGDTIFELDLEAWIDFFFLNQMLIEMSRKRPLQVQVKAKAKWESLFVIRECNVRMELKIKLEKMSWRQIRDALNAN